MGEIKKMGLTPLTKNTVKRILCENGFDPSYVFVEQALKQPNSAP